MRSRKTPQQALPANLTNALEMLVQMEEIEAKKYWKPELEAQARAKAVEELWNKLNRSDDKLDSLAELLDAREIVLPIFGNGRNAAHGVRVFSVTDSARVSKADWKKQLDQKRAEGWKLERCEFRHIGIAPDTFYVSAHLRKEISSELAILDYKDGSRGRSPSLGNDLMSERAILEGNIVIKFQTDGSLGEIDASGLGLRTRTGPPAFTEMFHAEVRPPDGSYFIDPLIVWDLDADQRLEVILAAANVVFRRAENGKWTPSSLIQNDPGLMFGAILGDFSGNGMTDFLSVKFEGLVLFEGTTDGRFTEAGRLAWAAEPRLRYAQSVTGGDVDGDGDLDLFVGQYKLPYNEGQMPFPYFDANDGFPSFLLINDGAGNFSDRTRESGLSAKRGRRVYSSSLVDLDSDRDLDLVMVSDFAGLDAFENDGSGNFSDATKKWFDETHAFGMAHSISDFNADGRLDLLMIGMNSPNADRLASVNLSRPYDMPDAGMRQATTFGNRLYFGQSNGTFRQTDLSRQVARTGWSWGSAAGDLDNDGFPELYIANGHETRELVDEYEPEFWLHDIYIGKSQENRLAQMYFQQKYARTRGRGYSYGGHEKNRLFLNEGGTNFVEVAHLFGVAMEQDSRNVALQDFDGDARLDLVVTTFEGYPEVRQTIRIFRNELKPAADAVSVQLKDPARMGATGKLAGSRTNAFAIVSGESYRTQLPPSAWIGVGNSEEQVTTDTNLFRVAPRREEKPGDAGD